MRLAQQGDGAAYRRLLDEARRLASAFIKRELRSSEQHEDVVQEVLVAVHNKRHTYDSSRPFLPWFYAIVRYKVADHWRDRGSESTRFADIVEELENEAAPPGFDGESELAAKDLAALLDSLPEKQRDAIRLVKLEGLSIAEAAQRLGISESDVKVSVHRGIKKLLEKIRASDGTKT